MPWPTVANTGDRVREITTDGKIRTIAGYGAYGFNGDNQSATSAALDTPTGIAVDRNGVVYIADMFNSRVRKFTVGGTISTVVLAALPAGLAIDGNGNLFITDIFFNVLVKLSNSGSVTLMAGNNSAFGVVKDGLASNSNIDGPLNVSVDDAGNLYLVEATHLVRRLALGVLTTMAGKVHYGGDNGPAVSALLNQPTDVALDNKGNVFIADASNYLIRKVSADGTITTYGGKPQQSGTPLEGTIIGNNLLPYINAMASDASGALYFASDLRVYRIDPSSGVIATIAGGTTSGNGGDRGPATAATFKSITGMAIDTAGNIYLADSGANRVRMIAAATGVITAFAGTGNDGATGDGGQATAATLSLLAPSPLAVDSKGNVYIGDGNNLKVRMVNPAGVISTVAGNGAFGRPDGGSALTAFSQPTGLTTDAAGTLFISSYDFSDIYAVSGGSIRRIVGNGSAPPSDGVAALNTSFYAEGLKTAANGDVYAVDLDSNIIRKLVVNTPASFTVVSGDNQTGVAGKALANPLRVQVTGKIGGGLAGVTVNFAVTSGSATLSPSSATTDQNGTAAVTVTLGPAAGTLAVTASIAGTSLPPLVFTATATTGPPPPPACSVPQPVVTSAGSAGDFGGSSTFASGSWLEIKGRNLSQTTRQWSGDDFTGPNAPTTLDGVTVTINGKNAFISYISPSQINVQAPADAANGDAAVVVTTASCSSAAVTAPKAAVAPGMLSPSVFNVDGKQYLVATFTDGFTYVGRPGLIAGVPFRAAKPGDSILTYGIGFGDVQPAIAPGVVVTANNTVPNLAVSFGTTPATVLYGGLAPNAIGLYQFNIVVPELPDGDYAIVFRAGSTTAAQTVYLTIASGR